VSEAEKSPVVLSFDVEEHHRIEAAAGLQVANDLKADYAARMERSTRGLLDQLAAAAVPATFYVVGQIAETHPQLIRAIAAAGHEIGTHSWNHQRVHRFSEIAFREDVLRSKGVLESVSGQPVVGYRAPTFSVVRETSWAVDVLAECGLRYDSSIFPVRHDRYGVPDAPRTPFVVEGLRGSILELPPVTYRAFGQNLPVAGGGYFRLFPLGMMRAGIAQLALSEPQLAMLYFHPWEFDLDQPRLPLSRVARWRTYVGISKSRDRLSELLVRYAGRFRRAIDVVESLQPISDRLPRFRLAPS